MSHRDAAAICRKIDAALEGIGGDNGDEMRPYLLYQIDQMMGGAPEHITMHDCTTPELMALAALLAPIFSRRLAGNPVGVSTKAKVKRIHLVHPTGTD